MLCSLLGVVAFWVFGQQFVVGFALFVVACSGRVVGFVLFLAFCLRWLSSINCRSKKKISVYLNSIIETEMIISSSTLHLTFKDNIVPTMSMHDHDL